MFLKWDQGKISHNPTVSHYVDWGWDEQMVRTYLNNASIDESPISIYLQEPESGIDAAAKLLRGFLDDLSNKIAKNLLSKNFQLNVAANSSKLNVPNDISAIDLNPSQDLVSAIEAIWNNGKSITESSNIPKDSPNVIAHVSNGIWVLEFLSDYLNK